MLPLFANANSNDLELQGGFERSKFTNNQGDDLVAVIAKFDVSDFDSSSIDQVMHKEILIRIVRGTTSYAIIPNVEGSFLDSVFLLGPRTDVGKALVSARII